MRRSLVAIVALASCGAPKPAPAPVIARAPAEPAMIRTPDGWTDLIATPRDRVEALAPGLYDQVHAMIERDGYVILAMALDPASPDRGSQMTALPYGRPGPVDQAFLDGFVADNNLGLAPADVVEQKLLQVGGRPIAKVRAEYQGATNRVDTLVYLFPDDAGAVIQLVFTVRAERYAALRPQLEAIEGGDPTARAILRSRRGT